MIRFVRLAVLGLLLGGCASTAPPPAPVAQSPSPHSKDGPDLSTIRSVEGLVYRVDGKELLLRGDRASSLRFKATPGSLESLHRGDRIRVHIRYAGQGMELESFDLLAQATPEALFRLDHSPNPHMKNPHAH